MDRAPFTETLLSKLTLAVGRFQRRSKERERERREREQSNTVYYFLMIESLCLQNDIFERRSKIQRRFMSYV